MDISGEIQPFILSGGSGVRLWPLSRRAYPKQFLNLTGDLSPLQQTLNRVDDKIFASPTVICANEHRFIVGDQLRELGGNDVSIILEPVARNTAPAALIAALIAAEKDPATLLLLLPSDHMIDDEKSFIGSVLSARDTAYAGSIVTFGCFIFWFSCRFSTLHVFVNITNAIHRF